MALNPLPFFFRDGFPLLDEKQIQTETRALLDKEDDLKDKYNKIKVLKNGVKHFFFANEEEAAVDIQLHVKVSVKIRAFFQALGALFHGRNKHFELKPQTEAISEFFQFKDKEGVEDLQAAHQQGKTIHIYVGLRPAYKRLHCIVKGSDALRHVYKGSIKVYRAIRQTDTDRKVYFLLNKFLMVRELNLSYRIARLWAENRTNEEDADRKSERALKAFSQSMLNLSRFFGIRVEDYMNLLTEWQETHPDAELNEEEKKQGQNVGEAAEALLADPTIENLIPRVDRNIYLYPFWCRLVERIILDDLHALFKSIGDLELTQRLIVLPEKEKEWLGLIQRVEVNCRSTDSLNALCDIFTKFKFFINTTRVCLPHKR